MSSVEDQPWGWESPCPGVGGGANGLGVPSEVGREGAVECPGHSPAISEAGSLYPSHSYPGPEVTVTLQLLKCFCTQSLPRLSQQPNEVRFSHPTDGEGLRRGLDLLKSETQLGRMD